MSIRAYGLLAGAVALLVWASPDPAQALTEHECSLKYKAAESAGTLNGMSWNEFRRAECSADASPQAAAPAATPQPNNSSASAGSGLPLSEHECSQQYRAAQAAGTLNGMKWNDFRRAECGAGASTAAATSAPTPVAPAAPSTGESDADNGLASWLQNLFPGGSAPSGNQSATGAPAQSYASATFPASVSPQYSNESIGRARELTCLDQYRANKGRGGNAGLEWIQRGGGYYSECNKRLGGK